jgi:hypothetical protein
MLTKMENGKELICSDEEEKLIRMMWSLNDKYPDYSGHLMFDGVSEPKHNIEACKFYHRQMVESIIAKKIATVNLNIETAEESGDDSAKKTLLQARKSLKGQLSYDDSGWSTIDDLQKHLEAINSL